VIAGKIHQTYKLVSNMRKINSSNYRNEAELVANCPLAAAMKLIGGRWKMMLLWYVAHGVNRYNTLKNTIPHISEKMLYQQLRELERDGLLLRVVSGRAVHYEPTTLAQSLQPVLASIADWSEHNKVANRFSNDERM
jgi:DNA-binding HxlR family transcriptional regulator